MSQTQKLDNIIRRIIKEELDEKKTLYPTTTGDIGGIKDMKDKEQAKKDLQKGKAVQLVKPEDISTLKEKESEEMEVADTEVLESMPTGTEIAGKISEVIDALNRISEAGKDEKHKKQAAKVMKAMESAKAALEALTAHEMMLEEKEKEAEKKDAEKHIKGFKKHLTKLVKEPGAVEKISAKLTPEKMADLKKRMKSGELDEEKLARVMLQHSLKEGWVKESAAKTAVEADLDKLSAGVKSFGETLKKAGFNVTKRRK